MIPNELLNEINIVYGKLEDKCTKLRGLINGTGEETAYGWYNNHYRKDESGEWVREAYPIQVITVKGICDIEIEFDRISVSAKLRREDAFNYDYQKFAAYSFEVYGVEDYLADYYHEGQKISVLKENISACGEKEIGYSFYFEFDCDEKVISEFVGLLADEGFYY